MRHTPLIALALLLFMALPTLAETLVEVEHESADTVKKDNSDFTLAAETELTMTVATREGPQQGGATLQVYLFRVEADGKLTEIVKYRLMIRHTQRPTTGKINLPAGDYRLTTVALRMDCAVKLEDHND